MKKNLFLFGFVLMATAMMAQTEKSESWYFKIGGSYFMQTAATEFPVVNGQAPNSDVYGVDGTTLISRKANHGSFGEGFRSGLTAGYRFSTRLGLEMGINYYSSADKLMVETTNRLVPQTTNIFVTGDAVGKITAWDLSPSLVLFLGETKGFEPYTKVGVIVPVHGDLTIKTNREYSATTPIGSMVVARTYSEDVVKPNPTIGFMAVIGTSYKLAKKLSAFAEVEYRNFTVHGKTKETTVFTENGVDKLHTPSTFRPDASYSAIHANYVDKLTTSSNSKVTNAAGFDATKATDDVSSFVGISGLGLTLGLKYSL
ncbi:MAG: hypothetical protein EAZ58_07005 [Flavobacterium sp.]|jgi:opacity protein-like surface antigen|nr:MAG: hypothetical protein EAZ58_07005 [Flavobacterium sp.]